mgnify:CR=1 FL=1
MAKTPAKLKKPEPRACGDIRYRVVRGPREADGRWYWRAERYFSGGAETVWTGWGTVVEADRQVVALAAGGGARAPAETDLVADLLAYWLGAQEERPDISAHTLRIRTDQCAHLKSGLGTVLLSRLDRAAMEGYRDRQLRAGRAPVTVGHELSVLRTAWQWGRECGVCPAKELPSVRVKIVKRRDTPEPDRGAVVAALEHLKGWPRLAVLLLEGTGCRLGEVCSLTWDRVDLDRGEIRVQGKTGGRTVPLSDALVRELAAFPRKSERVLGLASNSARAALGLAIKHACEAAGVPVFAPQGLRRAAVGALYRSGVDVGTAAAFLGHSPVTALHHYREASEADRRGAMLRSGLGRLVEEQGQVIQLSERRQRRER